MSTAGQNYRLFVIYHLISLKALDGLAVVWQILRKPTSYNKWQIISLRSTEFKHANSVGREKVLLCNSCKEIDTEIFDDIVIFIDQFAFQSMFLIS